MTKENLMLLLFIVTTALLAALGGVAIGLFLAEVLDLTRRPEDDLARRARRGVRA